MSHRFSAFGRNFWLKLKIKLSTQNINFRSWREKKMWNKLCILVYIVRDFTAKSFEKWKIWVRHCLLNHLCVAGDVILIIFYLVENRMASVIIGIVWTIHTSGHIYVVLLNWRVRSCKSAGTHTKQKKNYLIGHTN